MTFNMFLFVCVYFCFAFFFLVEIIYRRFWLTLFIVTIIFKPFSREKETLLPSLPKLFADLFVDLSLIIKLLKCSHLMLSLVVVCLVLLFYLRPNVVFFSLNFSLFSPCLLLYTDFAAWNSFLNSCYFTSEIWCSFTNAQRLLFILAFIFFFFHLILCCY